MNNITLKYNVDVSNLQVFKNEEDMYKYFFYSGHPGFLIPDFHKEIYDISSSFIDYLEKYYENNIFDQNGGEIHSYKIVDNDSGLTECSYTAYDIMLDEDASEEDYELTIKGYVINTDEPYFLATEVVIK